MSDVETSLAGCITLSKPYINHVKHIPLPFPNSNSCHVNSTRGTRAGKKIELIKEDHIVKVRLPYLAK